MPDALEATVQSLPMDWQDLPIVSTYLIEQQQRAVSCERVAADGVRLAGSRQRPPSPSGTGVQDGPPDDGLSADSLHDWEQVGTPGPWSEGELNP